MESLLLYNGPVFGDLPFPFFDFSRADRVDFWRKFMLDIIEHAF